MFLQVNGRIILHKTIFLTLFYLFSPMQGFAQQYNIAEARQSFEYKFFEWNNRTYELTGRIILINAKKAIIHLPRRNYGYTKFIYSDVNLNDTELSKIQDCKNLCFISGNFSFSGNQGGLFGSEYQIDATMLNFSIGLDADLIPENRRFFSDLRKLDELFTSISEKNDGRYPPTFFFEFGEEPKADEIKDDT